MKQRHNPDASAYHEYYLNQAGRGYPVYAGTRYQRGHGLGSIIGSLFKSAVPLLKRGAKTLGREALKTGLNLTSDVMEGQNVKQAVKSRLKSTGQNLLQKAMDTVGPPGQRSIKRAAKRKKPRRRQTKLWNTYRKTSSVKNGSNSCESRKSKLDLFGVPPTQTSVEHGYWEQQGLTSALTDQGPYEFAVSGAGDDYIDLANAYLFVEAQIVNTDGSNLDPDTDIGPVDLWMHSLFNDVSVSLSEKLVSPPTSMYPYRAYIETLLRYGPAAKESQLTGVMWYTPGQQDKRTTDNKGFTSR